MSEISMTEENNNDVRPSFVVQLQKHWKLLLGGLLVGSLIGAGMVWNKAADYTSTATIIFPNNPGGRMASLPGGAGGGDMPSMPLLDGIRMVPQPGTSADTAMMLLKSRRSYRGIMEKMNADSTTTSGSGSKANIVMDHYNVNTEDRLFVILDKTINMKVGKNGELLLSITDTDKEFAGKLAQKVIEELNSMTQELRLNPAAESVDFLDKQLRMANTNFNSSQSALAAFQKENNLISLPDQARALAAQYSSMQDEVNRAEMTAKIAKAQYDKAAQDTGFMIKNFVDPSGGPGSAAGNSLTALYKKVKDLESERAILLNKLTANHPDVQNKDNQIVEANRMLNEEVKRQKELLKGDVSPSVIDMAVNSFVASAKYDGLKIALGKVKEQVKGLPDQEGKFTSLSADVEAAANSIKMYRGELEKANLLAKDSGHLFEVLDAPEVPTEPNARGRGKTIAIFALLGLFLPMALPAIKFSRQLQEYEDALLANAEKASDHSGCPFMKNAQQQDNDQ